MSRTRIYVKALFSQGHCHADLAAAGHTRRKNIIHERTNCLLILFLILDYVVLFLFFFAVATVAFGTGQTGDVEKHNHLSNQVAPERSA